MKILEGALREDCIIPTFQVRFEERNIEEIACNYTHKNYEKVKNLSEWNEALYHQWISPWVQMASNPFSATAMRWLHPMRTTRYMCSSFLNPAMWGIASLAPLVRQNRMAIEQDNPLLQAEGEASKQIADGMHEIKKATDDGSKEIFHLIYGLTATNFRT